MAHRAILSSPGTLTSAMKHPCRNQCCVGPSRLRCRLQHVDIRDRASVLKPFASMTYRAILSRLSTLTSAIERSCCCERQGKSAHASAQWFSVLHFRGFSTSFHSPPAQTNGQARRTANARKQIAVKVPVDDSVHCAPTMRSSIFASSGRSPERTRRGVSSRQDGSSRKARTNSGSASSTRCMFARATACQ